MFDVFMWCLAFIGASAVCLVLYELYKFVSRLRHLLEWFEYDNDLLNEMLDWFEEFNEQPIPQAENVFRFKNKTVGVSAEKPAEKPAEKQEKEFWNDLAALEAERENIENGGSNMPVSDSLDHVRAVHERIAELKEESTPQPAA